MSTVSPKLSLPYIQVNQAQKHVTHNEAIRALDSLVQLSVNASDQSSAPSAPVPGESYIVAAGATGNWVGHEGEIAIWDENHWRFAMPVEGWIAWDADAGSQLIFTMGAWVPLQGDMQNLAIIGINNTADDTNRLSVASNATLFTHDTNGDHQLKINKDTQTDYASLLFQTGWSGRVEMGTTGSDNFEIKVSPDGTIFHQAVVVDGETGAVSFPNTDFILNDFGDGELVNVDYLTAKGLDLVANGSGLLGNSYNMPSSFSFDPSDAPNLPGSFVYSGHYTGAKTIVEFLPVNPNEVYKLSCYIKQQSLPGDWSAFTYGDRHAQYIGLMAYDIDKNIINAEHHMRYKSGGVDSLTTLTAPLTPGDLVVSVDDTAGWNDSNSAYYLRGMIIFGYKNSLGVEYDRYSRFYKFNMFDTSGVDKTNNQISLSAPFPADLANPDDPNGTWPVGTRIANCSSGGAFKYSLLPGTILPSSGDWYQAINYIGGIDASGTNVTNNFPPGTAYVKVFWLPNHSNRVGGYSAFADTGANHGILFSGVSVLPSQLASTQVDAQGRTNLKVPRSDFAAGSVTLEVPTLSLQML